YFHALYGRAAAKRRARHPICRGFELADLLYPNLREAVIAYQMMAERLGPLLFNGPARLAQAKPLAPRLASRLTQTSWSARDAAFDTRLLKDVFGALLPALLFGLRLWTSVCLALYVAFWLELDNAFWAGTSAAIVCQPHLGASLRKGWFRLIG